MQRHGCICNTLLGLRAINKELVCESNKQLHSSPVRNIVTDSHVHVLDTYQS